MQNKDLFADVTDAQVAQALAGIAVIVRDAAKEGWVMDPRTYRGIADVIDEALKRWRGPEDAK